MAVRRDGEQTRQAVYDYINQYIKAHGFAPTRREIGEALGVGMPTVQNALRGLEEQGKVTLFGRVARAIGIRRKEG